LKESRLTIQLYCLVLILFLTACTSQPSDLPPSQQFIGDNNDSAIIFVHGLMGNVTQSWTNSNSNSYFPKLIFDELGDEGFDVFSASYYSGLIDNKYNLAEMGDFLTTELELLGVFDNKYKNLVFVSHSMGNFVTRSSIRDNVELYKQFKIPLILSMGAPSNGSQLAWYITNILPNSTLARTLSSSQTMYVLKLNESWESMKGNTIISCAYEKLDQSFMLGMIVDEKSATSICNGDSWPVFANHVDMIKPFGENDRVYLWTLRQIRKNADRQELSSLKNFENLYTPMKIDFKDHNITESTRNLIVKNLMSKVENTYSTSVIDLLKNEIPKVPGGVTCEEMALFIEPSYSSHKPQIVKYSIDFIQTPVDKQCITKLSKEAGVYFSTNEIIKMTKSE